MDILNNSIMKINTLQWTIYIANKIKNNFNHALFNKLGIEIKYVIIVQVF